MLVYATHTGTRDITERMEQFLSQHGFKVAVLKADTVAPDRRESWVDERVKQGVDVLVCHPRLVQTGLDLVDFPYNLLVRDRVLCLPIDTKKYGSHGQSIWMHLRLSRLQRAAETTDLPSLVDQ